MAEPDIRRLLTLLVSGASGVLPSTSILGETHASEKPMPTPPDHQPGHARYGMSPSSRLPTRQRALRPAHCVHLATFSGGTQAPLPRPMLAAFISCADIVDGSIAHSCMHGPGPHYIKVIVPKTANDKKVVAELCRSAERRSAA